MTIKKIMTRKELVDNITIFILGAFCYCYAVFFSSFAELNIKLPFLNFPIFVGEILLALCIVLLIIKWKVSSIRFNRWHYLLFAFISFILIKAAYGYIKWGPLALRNAALFYYSLFTLIAYDVFDDKLLKNKVVFCLTIFTIAAMLLFRLTSGTFAYTFLIIAFALVLSIRNKRVKLISLLCLLAIIPYKPLIMVSRGVLISQVGALLLIVVSLFFVSGLKLKSKAIISFTLFIVFCSLLYFFGSKTDILSLVSPRLSLRKYHECVKVIEERRGSFKPLDVPSRIFEENYVREIIADPSYNQNGEEPPKRISKELKLAALSARRAAAGAEAMAIKADKTAELIKSLGTAKTDAAAKEAEKSAEMSRKIAKKARFAADEAERKLEKIKMQMDVSARNAIIVKNEAKTIAETAKKIAKKTDKASKRTMDTIVSAQRLIPFKDFSDEKTHRKISQREIFGFGQNITWRLFVWQDMLEELLESRKNLLGLDFGKPFRSKRAEILGWETGLGRVGWLEPHNSYLHIIYRAGIFGLLFIIAIWILFFTMIKSFIKTSNIKGILLSSALFFWLFKANFAVMLELPYFAIPFWSLFGVVMAYYQRNLTYRKKPNAN